MREQSGLSLLPGFEDLREIGRGGFGVVYSAFQPEFRRRVAIKVLSVQSLDARTLERFEREAAAAGQLSGHPHVVTLHGSGVTPSGAPYLVMPLLEGGSLGQVVASGGIGGAHDWSVQRLVEVGVKVAGGLASAHRAGVLHRDVKPDNVLLDGFGEPVLTDFGIATIVGSATTKTGEVTASLAYAAPEVLSGRRADVAADVYALAATLHALARGRSPFIEESDEGVAPMLARILAAPPPDLRPDGVPDAICDVLEQGLSKDPVDRWTSAEAFGEALGAAQSAQGWPVSELRVSGSPAGGRPEGRVSNGGRADERHAPSAPADRHDEAQVTRARATAAAIGPDADPAYRLTRRHGAAAKEAPAPERARSSVMIVTLAVLGAALGMGIVAVVLWLGQRGDEAPAVTDVASAPVTTAAPTGGSASPSTAMPTTAPAPLPVPDVVGLPYTDAVGALRDAGFELVERLEAAADPGVAPSAVIAQDPAPLEQAVTEAAVRLTVAVEVPVEALRPVAATATNQRSSVDLRCTGERVNYAPENLIDGNHDTGWGASSADGTGQSVTLTFAAPVRLTRIGLTPGYTRVGPRQDQGCAEVLAFPFNRVVTSVSYAFDDGSAITQTFERLAELQYQDVDVTTTTVRITVLGTDRGSGADDDTVISEAVFEGAG